MSYYQLDMEVPLHVDTVMDFYLSLPEQERAEGRWVFDDVTLLTVKTFRDHAGGSLWRDDLSEHGQFLTRPIIVDNKVDRGLCFCVLLPFEHMSRHAYLHKHLVELTNDYPESLNYPISCMLEWSHSQTQAPEVGKFTAHPIYPRRSTCGSEA